VRPAGLPGQPFDAAHQLGSLDALYDLATAEGIVIPAEIKTAC
jgi:hypothetical protein